MAPQQAAWPQGAPQPPGQLPGRAPAPSQPSWQPPAPTKKGRDPLKTGIIGLIVAVVAVGAVIMAMQAIKGSGSETTGPGGGYANETYTPPPATREMPPLPVPETLAEAEELVKDNKLYQQAVVVPTRCEAGDPDLQAATKSQLEKHMNDVVGCLMRVWVTPIEGAGWELPRPRVTVYDDKVTTPCGTAEGGNAFYCSADQQLYYSTTLADVMPPGVRGKRWTVEEVVAHEFGHFIQGRTGIAYSTYVLEDEATSKAAQHELSRRQELQADCMAGAFLHSVAQSKNMTEAELDVIRDAMYAFGDDVLSGKPNIDGTHGLGVNRQYWMEMGLSASQMSACNTYVAAPDAVR